MLLRHTPKEISERKALTINPAKTCQPSVLCTRPWASTDAYRTVMAPRGVAPIIDQPDPAL
ncbi:hypothetical protein H206_06184 [Candidatus Electrothrix aarhusensis]|uniref:Uncharacterized protein n=1 Tax=Candidatus Electrothrix aarhusensis TaxID=1859131 RepID=A0A3S3QHI5_9BACT|nr:hypothetical protein H206_06184 [Candidatus Electrothrix aarhusensis]